MCKQQWIKRYQQGETLAFANDAMHLKHIKESKRHLEKIGGLLTNLKEKQHFWRLLDIFLTVFQTPCYLLLSQVGLALREQTTRDQTLPAKRLLGLSYFPGILLDYQSAEITHRTLSFVDKDERKSNQQRLQWKSTRHVGSTIGMKLYYRPRALHTCLEGSRFFCTQTGAAVANDAYI